MKNQSLFMQYWSIFCFKSWSERREYFYSLTRKEQDALIQSFRDGRWIDLFLKNELDAILDEIKQIYHIDLIDLRIKAIKHGKVFLIKRSTWEEVENRLYPFSDHYDLSIFFGGLFISAWGNNRQWYRVRGVKDKWR